MIITKITESAVVKGMKSEYLIIFCRDFLGRKCVFFCELNL